ncbi:MAG: TIGR03857 family LLM class F420-dependent oxidoreductase [Acidimicrobiia bacterium]
MTDGQPHRVPLGAYTLPGRVADPRPAIGQAQMAEHLGLSTIWISERYGTKDVGVLGGAIAQATSRIQIGSAISHFLFRHPLALASMATTMQALSGGRFLLGIGRSVAPMWRAVGLPTMTNQVLADLADIHRRLCQGEKVKYDGPAGQFPSLRLGDVPDVTPPPILLAAIGPKTLDLAGRHFDGAILHPFLTVQAVRESVDKVRAGAEAAGRDPHAAKIYATVVTAPDLTEAQELAVVGGRAVTYFQIPDFGELLSSVSGWDPAGLADLRSHPMLANVRGSADNLFTKDQLAEVSQVLPREWLYEGAAIGSAGVCADRLREYLAAGADEILIHGAVPEYLGPTVQHFQAS